MDSIWTSLLGLCAGMALFLYSIKMTSGSLEVIAGNRMKMILAKLTGNRILGVTVGAGVTALVQSSTATTVMVIGFVNAGLMNLYSALWIIMGANIGTNITSQLIAFDIGVFAPVVALVGTFVCIFVKDKKLKSVGEAIAGLGFIFFSMSLMTSSMAPISISLWRGRLPFSTPFRFILTFPAIRIWLSASERWQGSISLKISIIPISRCPCAISGKGGISPSPHGSGNMSTFRSGATAKASFARGSTE